MCDLCGHEERIPGDQLCSVCREAIRRVAAAVSRIEQQTVQPTQGASGAVAKAEDYRAAFFDTRTVVP